MMEAGKGAVSMRAVRCYECGKRYDYDDDGFCPRCGAFNQPARGTSARTMAAAGEGKSASKAARGSGKKSQINSWEELEQGFRKLGRSLEEAMIGRQPPGGRLGGRLPRRSALKKRKY